MESVKISKGKDIRGQWIVFKDFFIRKKTEVGNKVGTNITYKKIKKSEEN